MAPSLSYYNATGPFWDFVADFESRAASHPFFHGDGGRESNDDREIEDQHGAEALHAHRDPNHGHSPPGSESPGFAHHHDSQDGGPSGHANHPPPPPPPPMHGHPPAHGPAPPPPPPPGFGHHGHGRGRGHRGGFGGRGRGRWGHHGHGSHGHEHHPGGDGAALPFAFGQWADFLASYTKPHHQKNKENDNFSPAMDVYDTASAYVVLVSLAGAKKEDVAVHWDREASSLVVTGIVQRSGDEDFIKSLAMAERQVGPFERKLRLGSKLRPAKVEEDMITAKFEDGILKIEVPKEDDGEFVEVKKVDIE